MSSTSKIPLGTFSEPPSSLADLLEESGVFQRPVGHKLPLGIASEPNGPVKPLDPTLN